MNTSRSHSNDYTELNLFEYSLNKCINVVTQSNYWWEFARNLLLQKLSEEDNHSVSFSAQTNTMLRLIYRGNPSGPDVILIYSHRKY